MNAVLVAPLPPVSTYDCAKGAEQRLELAEGRPPGAVCFDWILELRTCFMAGQYEAAIFAAEKAKPLLWTAYGHIQTLDYYYFGALAIAAASQTDGPESSSGRIETLKQYLEPLAEWEKSCPETFFDKYALVSAELARIEGRVLDAMQLYEEAIQASHENGFVQNEGIANELAAALYAARGFETIAHAYLRNARHCYLRWGANGKVRQLEELYPHPREEASVPTPTKTIAAPLEHLDLATVIKMSQAVSGEILLQKLIETLLKIAVEQAGAERGLLILPQGEQYRIEAEIKPGPDQVEVQLRQAPVPARNASRSDAGGISFELPESLLRYVIRTQEKVILADASAQNLFSEDEYVQYQCPRSVLCLPLVKQTKLTGVLYLENNLAPGVFTPKRLAILELLASQAAISLDHARLYAELAQENSERRKAEESLRASEERWRKLFENSSAGIALVAPDGHYIATNVAFQKMLGYTEQELQELTTLDLTPEEDRAAFKALRAEALAGQQRFYRVEKRYRRKDGSLIWADISATIVPAPGSESAFFLGVIVDISERKRAEEELRRSEAFLVQGQRISHTGSWGWKVATGALYWSEEHFRIFGLDPETDKPSYSLFMERIHPEDRAPFEELLNQTIRGKSDFENEYRIVLPDGSIKFVRSVGQPRVSPSGELEYIGTVMDITERKRAEEAWQKAQAELAHVTRLATLGELMTTIAHEINQPLGAIANNAGACVRWLRSQNLEEAQRSASLVIADGHRAGEIIGRIRALAKKAPLQKDWLDLNETIGEVIAMVQGEVTRSGVLPQTRLADDLPLIMGDRIQLQQVILNLVINAIEAMSGVSEGLRQLWVSSEKVATIPGDAERERFEAQSSVGHEDLSSEALAKEDLGRSFAEAERTHVLISVADSGPGLDPNTRDHLFDAFYTTKPQGLGMGLAISRSIVVAHGGRFWATANLPKGALFQFTFPISQ